MSIVYDRVNEAFKKTSKILFKQEIGELTEFEEYLKEMMFPPDIRKSFISGKEVMTALKYPEDARIVSQDELGQVKFKPVDVNKIKDIDSLVEAVQENVIYCGNRLFGKNEGVELSDTVMDSVNIYKCHGTWRIKYGAYTACSRESEYSFGVSGYPKSKFCMRSIWGIDIARCFEAYYTNYSSDCLFAFNNTGCSETLFCFNQRNKRHMIGNLEIPKEKYFELKGKLVGEITEELKKNKRFISLMDIPRVYGGVRGKKAVYHEPAARKARKVEKINKAFAAATKVVLGKELGPITEYEDWLLKSTIVVEAVEGALGTKTYKPEGVPILEDIPVARLVTEEEALKLGKEKKIELRDYSLKELLNEVAKIAYFTHEYKVGECADNYDHPIVYGSVDTYRVFDATYSKHCGCTFTPVRNSEYIFGGKIRLLQSKFCINCYEPVQLNNCFEVDSSYSSTNCYFCHNVENVNDGIFCFNVKSKRYCIGNTEVGKEEFLRIKKILLDYVLEKLEKDKDLELGIFNIKV